MKKNLQSIADQLSERDIQEIIKIRKMNDKKVVALRKKRDRLAAQLAKLDGQIAKITGGESPEPRARRGRKPGRPATPASTTAAAAASTAAPRAVAKTRKTKGQSKSKSSAGRGASAQRPNLSAAVREVFAKADAPLKASQVVDGLPGVGVQVKDVQEMRKRVSVVLASQKNYFEQVERGVYQLKSAE